MTDHSFNIFIAKNYGINEAIFINNMVFWTRNNASSEKNYHEERYWAFGTPEFFSKYFPYFKPRLIKDIIKSCINQGLLIKNNFNKKGYDQTSWFSLSDKVLLELNLDKTCLQPSPELIRRKTSNGLDGLRPMDWTDYVQPIPDTKPDTKPNNTHTIEGCGLEQNLFIESEQQRKACLLRKDCLKNEKAKEKYEQLPEDKKKDKTFVDVLDECVTYYATQQKPQLVSPQRLITWINRELDQIKKESANTDKISYCRKVFQLSVVNKKQTEYDDSTTDWFDEVNP